MPNRKSELVASVAMLVLTTACSTVDDAPPASATDRSRSSWCQGDAELSYAQADEEGQDDPSNVLDSEETVKEIQAHNVRYRAACGGSD